MSVEGYVLRVRDTGNLDLICMLTFLLSINKCLTQSLAKHSGIDFQREFASDHLKCFAQQLVFGGRNRRRRWKHHTKRMWVAVGLGGRCQRPQLPMSGTSSFGRWSHGGNVELWSPSGLEFLGAFGEFTFPLLTLESLIYKLDVMIPTTRDADSLLDIYKHSLNFNSPGTKEGKSFPIHLSHRTSGLFFFMWLLRRGLLSEHTERGMCALCPAGEHPLLLAQMPRDKMDTLQGQQPLPSPKTL